MPTKMNRSEQQPYVPKGDDNGGEYRSYGFGGQAVPKGAYKQKKEKIKLKEKKDKPKRTKEEQEFIDESIGERVEAIDKPIYVKKTYEELKKDDDLAIADWFSPDLSTGKRWDGYYIPTGKETEKAVQVLFYWESADGEYEGTERGWIPKSAFVSAKYLRDYKQRREYRLQSAMEEGFDKNLKLKEMALKNGVLKESDKRKHNMRWFSRKLTEIGMQEEVVKIIGEDKFKEFQIQDDFEKTREELIKVYRDITKDDRKKSSLDFWSNKKFLDRINKSVVHNKKELTDEQKAVIDKMKGFLK